MARGSGRVKIVLHVSVHAHVAALVEQLDLRVASVPQNCAMLLPSGIANTRCSVCQFDRSDPYGQHEAQLERDARCDDD
jgi:hypothetical protein